MQKNDEQIRSLITEFPVGTSTTVEFATTRFY
jgi:hypothetical protein